MYSDLNFSSFNNNNNMYTCVSCQLLSGGLQQNCTCYPIDQQVKVQQWIIDYTIQLKRLVSHQYQFVYKECTILYSITDTQNTTHQNNILMEMGMVKCKNQGKVQEHVPCLQYCVNITFFFSLGTALCYDLFYTFYTLNNRS